MMPADYHMHLVDDYHLDRCPYTLERIEQYVVAAQRRGIREIGITDHCHRFAEFRELFRPIYDGPRRHDPEVNWLKDNLYEQLDRYVESLVLAQQRGWPVKIGIEVDWFSYGGSSGFEDELKSILAPYPWDYVLGSVHFLGDWPVDVSKDYGWPEIDVEKAYAQYFAALQDAAGSGLYDIMAHPDLIKKFGHRVDDPTIHYEATVEAALHSGVALEISTAGLHYPVGELYPAQPLLEAAARRGVPITFASDAHDPAHVGRDMDRAVAAAEAAGHTETVVFSRRRSQRVSIAGLRPANPA